MNTWAKEDVCKTCEIFCYRNLVFPASLDATAIFLFNKEYTCKKISMNTFWSVSKSFDLNHETMCNLLSQLIKVC